MKQLLSVSLLLSLICGSCSKDDNPAPAPPASLNYQPMTVGSTWNYKLKNKITSVETPYVVTATSAEKVVNGKNYKEFTSTNLTAPKEYYYRSGNDYYQYGGLAGITDNTEINYLKANIAVNGEWNEPGKTVTIPGLGTATLDVNYKIIDAAPLTVEGKLYTGVVRVKTTMQNVQVSGFPVPITAQNIEAWYADGVGRIKQQIKLNITGMAPTDNETTLVDSDIKP